MKTTVVNCQKSEYDVYIGRPSKWGNPFKIGRDGNRDEVCVMHWNWLVEKLSAPDGRKPPTFDEMQNELTGKRLGCYCAPLRCHGDNYVLICNNGEIPKTKQMEI